MAQKVQKYQWLAGWCFNGIRQYHAFSLSKRDEAVKFLKGQLEEIYRNANKSNEAVYDVLAKIQLKSEASENFIYKDAFLSIKGNGARIELEFTLYLMPVD